MVCVVHITGYIFISLIYWDIGSKFASLQVVVLKDGCVSK